MSYDEDSIDWEEFPSGSLFFDVLGTPVVWESAPNGAAFVFDPDQRPCPLGLILEYGREIGRRDFNSVWANARFDHIRLGCGAYGPKALQKPSLISRRTDEFSGVVSSPCGILQFMADLKVGKLFPESPGAYPLSAFPRKYWHVEVSMLATTYPPFNEAREISNNGYDNCYVACVLSSKKLGEVIKQGFFVFVKDGPFDSKGDAEYAMDLSWESD